jgi:phosphoribosylformylglycinamidine synthase
VLAICNGFQVSCEAGLLPGALLRNASLQFVSRLISMRVENSESMFTREYFQGQVLSVPVAHGDGRYVADADVLARLEDENRVVFRYCGADASISPEDNVNGSANGIAGILNEQGNVLGLMPHPERAVDPILGVPDGLGVFHSLLAGVAA